jgi:DNA repair protein RecO (recombination protein O)
MDRAYVLHRRRYRETSLIVDLLTAERGRVGAVARGVLRTAARGGTRLEPGSRLLVTLRGRGELLTLAQADGEGGPLLAGAHLYALFYVNELVLKLTAAHDPNARLFGVYEDTLEALTRAAPLEPTLRRYELGLLDALGLGLDCSREAASGAAIEAALEYHYVVERGALARPDARGVRVGGATLLALSGTVALSETAAREAKRLMRHVIDHHLDGRPLASRQLFSAHKGRKP